MIAPQSAFSSRGLKLARPSTISKPWAIEESVMEIDISEQDMEYQSGEEEVLSMH